MKVKQLLVGIACAGLLASATTALAGKGSGKSSECSASAKEKKEKPQKVRIAHCGCNSDGSDLVWKHLRVSTRAKGHLKHGPYSDENPREVGCAVPDTGEGETEVLFKRAVSDCRLADQENNIGSLGGLADCAAEGELDPEVGSSCSLLEGPPEIEDGGEEGEEPEEAEE